MPSRNTPSPSPPAQPPSSTEPTPSHRAAALRKVFALALATSLKTNSYANFAACFPTPATYCPSALEGVHRQLNARLHEECERDFEKILNERGVVEGLGCWDTLVEDARARRDRGIDRENAPAAPHMMGAEVLGKVWQAGYLRRLEGELTGKLEKQREENEKTMEDVRRQREEIEMLVRGLEGVVSDVEGSVVAMEGVEELKGLSWEMEGVVKASI